MESVLLTLWRASWQASVLVVLVLLVQGLMRHRLTPAWRSALWLLVVARLLLPITPSSPWSLFHLTDRIAGWIHSTPDTSATTLSARLPGSKPLCGRFEPLENRALHSPLSMQERRPQPQSVFNNPAQTPPSLESALSPTAESTRRTGPWLPIFFWTAQHRWPLFDDRLLGFPEDSEEADRFHAAHDAEQAARHTRNGRHLYEMGRLPEAEAELRRALELDPEHRAAQYYLHLIAEARREAVRRKVRDIALLEVRFDGLRLPVVLEHLQEAIRHDPAGRDLQFRIQPTENGMALAPSEDPPIGAATPSTSAEPIDLHEVMIHIVTPLRIVRLTDVLDAIVRFADQPICYFIDESGVVFTQAPPGSPEESHEPETRLFRVNLVRFLENEEQALELFGSPGVHLVPHFLHLNTTTGVLIVRATPDELRVVQHLLEVIDASVTPPLVALESRIARMNRADAKRLGLEWFTGTQMLGMLHDPVRSATTPAPGQLAGILTADQFNQIQHALELDPAVRVTKPPTITNLSGNQTRVAHYLPDNTRVEVDFLPLVQRNGYGIDLGVRLRAAYADGDSSIHDEPSSLKPRPARAYTTDAAIWDGQTILLGGSFPAAAEDPVTQKPTEADEILFVLLTPTITDPAGNRVHPPDRLPFDPSTVPSQEIGH